MQIASQLLTTHSNKLSAWLFDQNKPPDITPRKRIPSFSLGRDETMLQPNELPKLPKPLHTIFRGIAGTVGIAHETRLPGA